MWRTQKQPEKFIWRLRDTSLKKSPNEMILIKMKMEIQSQYTTSNNYMMTSLLKVQNQ